MSMVIGSGYLEKRNKGQFRKGRDWRNLVNGGFEPEERDGGGRRRKQECYSGS